MRDIKRADQRIKVYIVVMFGILFSICLTMLWMNGGYKEGGLLQLGTTYNVGEAELKIGNETCIYDENEDCYRVQAPVAELNFPIYSEQKKWKYLMIEVEKASPLPMGWVIDFLDADGNILAEKYHTVCLGTNKIKQTIKEKVQTIKIKITNYSGCTFRIKSIKLRQKYFTLEIFIRRSVAVFCGYLAILLLVLTLRCRNWYGLAEILQYIFQWLGDAWGRKLVSHVGKKARRTLRQGCFCVFFLAMIAMNIFNRGDYYPTGRYWILGAGAMLLLLGVLSWEKPLQKLNWHNANFFAFLFLWAMACFSDLMLYKSFSYVGYVMLFCCVFLVFIWQNNGNYQQFLEQTVRGLAWTIWPVTLYCVIFRQKKEGVLYNGCFLNHQGMAMYALALWIAFLVELQIQVHRKKLHWGRFAFGVLGAAISAFYLYYSYEVWCVIAAAAVFAIWLFYLILYRRKFRPNIKKLVFAAGAFSICSLGVVFVIKESVKCVPEYLGTARLYEGEIQITNETDEVIAGLEAAQPGWSAGVSKASDQDLRSKWAIYLQRINLLGNEQVVEWEGYRLEPYNGLIQLAYRYGIFILMPYFMFLFLSVYRAVKSTDFLWQAVVCAFLILLCFENIEMPFTQPLWLLMYLGFGGGFGNLDKEIVSE